MAHQPARPSAPINKISLLPLGLVALALALNLNNLAANSFWGDEILTGLFANQSPADVIRWTARDIHPPLYYLAAGAFTGAVLPQGASSDPGPLSDWLWRFPSAVAVVLSVAVTYRLAFHLLPPPNHRAAATAALLLGVAPVALKYGQEARMHATFMLLSALSTLLLFRALNRPRRRPRWLLFALATAANLYTMYFGFLILAAQTALVASRQIAKKSSRETILRTELAGFSLAVGLALLLYLPWWPVLFDILRRRVAVGAIEGGVGDPAQFLGGVVQALGPTPSPAAWLFFLLFAGGLVTMAKRAWPLALLAGLWLTLPSALPILLGDPRALQFRYAFVLPVYLTTVAGFLWHAAGWLTRRRPAGSDETANWSGIYLAWIFATISFIGLLGIYQQTKPNWREAAAYLDVHTKPADIILIGPLWDEGRFIDYYYRGPAQLLTPAAMVANIEGRAEGLRSGGGTVWAVNRFAPAESPAFENVDFQGVVISQPRLAVYEADLLRQAALDLAGQAVDAAYPWAAAAQAQGVLDPDPRTAQAAALRALGDALLAAGRPAQAIGPYQRAVDIFPGWVGGFIALAEAHEVTGNLPAAAEAYRQAVAFNLNWQGAEADNALALIEAENWLAALETYHQIIGD